MGRAFGIQQPDFQKARLMRYRKTLATPLPNETDLQQDWHPELGTIEQHVSFRLSWIEKSRQEATKHITEVETEFAKLTAEHERAMQRYRSHVRSFELGRHRVAEFLGDPEGRCVQGHKSLGTAPGVVQL